MEDINSMYQGKIKRVKTSLKGWGANVRGVNKEEKKNLTNELEVLEQMEELGPLSGVHIAIKGEIQEKLLHLYEEEEKFWFERSSHRWLLQGDSNSAFFHRVANGRRRKSMMYSLQDGELQIQGTGDLLLHATAYYKNLFGPGEGNLMRFNSNTWPMEERLSVSYNAELDKPFLESEVKRAIYLMVKNKAPGPDGIHVEFFQSCWAIVKDSVMSLFQDWYHGRLNPYRLNFGMIILLQKSQDADCIQK